MVVANRDRVGNALDLLKDGLRPFVERELKRVFKDKWEAEGDAALAGGAAPVSGAARWDPAALLSIVIGHWQAVFRDKLGAPDKTYVHEIKAVRNRWAHNEPFTLDDTNRALDSVKRLLQSIGAAPQAEQVDAQLQEVLRQRFDDLQKRETKKVAAQSLLGEPRQGYASWRQVITPHADVTKGTYLKAEFAADLAQVHRGGATPEYGDPREFYGRTFLTEGLKHLLRNALIRLSGKGGDPVIQLQTNFGGGKTHSMLALYHLVSGVKAGDLAGLEGLMKETGVALTPKARRAVFVGTARSAANVTRQDDGTETRTMWGDLAWQLGGKKGFAVVAEADKAGVSPGSDDLLKLFELAGPSLILIDEWVAYARSIHGLTGLPSGSFDANLSFAQALTEAAKAAKTTLVVASLPASDIEIGGEGGREALVRLQNTFARLESTWRSASQQESYEIVRRRLFQPIPADKIPQRDAVCRAFIDMYKQHAGEFPSHCKEKAYEDSIRSAYPIHPELFERLYTDWGGLERFQKTRGVLRLMAAVIHELWEKNDPNLLILPASVPLDSRDVHDELRRYLDEPWGAVIEKDVDGKDSLALRIDQQNADGLGRYSATRRVSRTTFIGTAPNEGSATKGIDDRLIKLGCVQPGESPQVFGDALRRLEDQATFLYSDGSRYWLSTQPSVNRLAKDRAAQFRVDILHEEIVRRIRVQAKDRDARGEFAGVHPCPPSSADVPDERDARLVILDPEHPHVPKGKDTKALVFAAETLERRGASPRIYRNALVFLAPNQQGLQDVESAVREWLAWRSIFDERVALNLDAHASRQAESKRDTADETVDLRIPEAYQLMLYPEQADPTAAITWAEVKVAGNEPLAVKASKKLISPHGALVAKTWGAEVLRGELDKIPLWRGDHVSIHQLAEDFAQYIYLQRLKNTEVLLGAIRDGSRLFSEMTFAYADGFDDKKRRYVGLSIGVHGAGASETGLLVKPEVALRQQVEERANSATANSMSGARPSPEAGAGSTASSGPPPVSVPTGPVLPTRFHATATIDPMKIGPDAAKIAEYVVAHLAGLDDSEIRITIEIEASTISGFPDSIQRIVSENSRTLKFKSSGFEQS